MTPIAAPPVARILDSLGVESSERAMFSWAALCLALLGAAAYALLVSAEALFIKRVGVDALPLALLASSLMLVLTTGALGRVASGGDRPRWMPRILLGLALALLPFAVLIGWDAPVVFALLVLLARQVLGLGQLVVWLALGDLVTGRQAKRLFAPLAGAVTLGAIVGSFGADAVARTVGLGGLLLACALLLALAALAGRRLRRLAPRRVERRAAHLALASPSLRGVTRQESYVELWRENRLFRLLLVALLAAGALGPVLYFQFSYLADAATRGPGGEEALISLYARLRGWMSVAMLGAQLLLSGRLYRRLGLPLTLSLWPASYLLGFSWLGIQPGLPAGVVGVASTRITEDGIALGALRVLFNLFPEGSRSRVANLLEGPVNRLGNALGNGLVLASIVWGGVAWIAYAAVPVAAVWLISALLLWRSYPGFLLGAASRHRLEGAGADRAELLDAGTVRALAPSLVERDPRVCRTAIDLVSDAEPALATGLLAEALLEAPDANRVFLVEALHQLAERRPPGSLRSEAAAAALERLLAGATPLPPEQRADLLQTYARLTGGENPDADSRARSRRMLERALGDCEAAVRVVAMAELHRRGRPPPGAVDLDAVLSEVLAGSDPLVRRAARRELRAMLLSTEPDARWRERLALLADHLDRRVDRAETAEALLAVARRHGAEADPCEVALRARLEDADPRVRSAVLAYLGHAQVTAATPRLVAALGSRRGEENLAAREGLVALGPEAVRSLLVDLEFGSPARRGAVLAVLDELALDAATLEALAAREHQAGCQVAVLLGAIAPAAGAPAAASRTRLLLRRLEERLEEAVGTVLCLTALLQQDPRIGELERSLRRTRDERQRDILLEALDALLPAEARDDLVPLLETQDATRRAAWAADRLDRRVPSREAAWAELRNDGDAITRRLAGAPGAGNGDGALQAEGGFVLDPMEVAVRLGDVAPFDRLGTAQLMRLSEELSEEHPPVGEAVYGEGEESDALYFVLEGAVELTTGDVPLERVGPGDFFGLTSALDGVPRSTTARVLEAVRLLRLDREPLLALMEAEPSLAIGLGQRLSLRVRALQERLRASR